jgi:hypothetical protein
LQILLNLKLSFCAYFTGYMVFARYGFGKGEVDARVDLEVVKIIVQGAGEDDKNAFRSSFFNWFSNNGGKYNLNEDTEISNNI